MAQAEDTTTSAHVTFAAQTEIDERRISQLHDPIKDLLPPPPTNVNTESGPMLNHGPSSFVRSSRTLTDLHRSQNALPTLTSESSNPCKTNMSTGFQSPTEPREDDEDLFTQLYEDELITLPMKRLSGPERNAAGTELAKRVEMMGRVQERREEVKGGIDWAVLGEDLVNKDEGQVDDVTEDVSVGRGEELPLKEEGMEAPKEAPLVPLKEASLPSPIERTVHRQKIARKDLIEQLSKRYRSVHSLSIRIIEEDPVLPLLGKEANGSSTSIEEKLRQPPIGQVKGIMQSLPEVQKEQLTEADNELDSLFIGTMEEEPPPFRMEENDALSTPASEDMDANRQPRSESPGRPYLEITEEDQTQRQTEGSVGKVESVELVQQKQSFENTEGFSNLRTEPREGAAPQSPLYGDVGNEAEASKDFNRGTLAKSVEGLDDDEDVLFLPMPEDHKALSPEKEALVPERGEKPKIAKVKPEDQMEAAREFQRKMLAGDDEDVIVIDKPAMPKEKTPVKNKTIKHEMSEHVERRPIIKRTDQSTSSRKSSGSSIEFTSSCKIKKPTLKESPTQSEKLQQKHDRKVRFKFESEDKNASQRPTLNATTAQPETSQQTPDPRLKGKLKVQNDSCSNTPTKGKPITNPTEARQTRLNFQGRVESKPSEALDASNPKSTAKPNTTNTISCLSTKESKQPLLSSTTSLPKSKPLHWKDVKEKPPSTKYGHDVNRPLGPDDGSMDAFIVTESELDTKSDTNRVKPAEEPKQKRQRPSAKTLKLEKLKQEHMERVHKHAGHRLRFQGYDELTRAHEDEQEQKQQRVTLAQQRRQQQEEMERQKEVLQLQEEVQRLKGEQDRRPHHSETRAAPTAHMYDTTPTSPHDRSIDSAGNADSPIQYRNTHRSHATFSESPARPRVRDDQANLPRTPQQLPQSLGKSEGSFDTSPGGEKSIQKQDTNDTNDGQGNNTASQPAQGGNANKAAPTHKPTTPTRTPLSKPKLTKEFTPSPPANKAAASSLCQHPLSIIQKSHHGSSPSKEGKVKAERPALSENVVLDGNQKRTLGAIPVGDSFDPKAIVSKKEDERKKRAKVDEKEPSTRKREMVDEAEERKVKKLKGEGSCDDEEQDDKLGSRIEALAARDERSASDPRNEVMEVPESQEPDRVWVSGKGRCSTEEGDRMQLSDEGKGELSVIEEPVAAISRPSIGGKSVPIVENIDLEDSSRGASPTLTPPPDVHPRTSRKTIPQARRAVTPSDPHTVEVSSPDVDNDDDEEGSDGYDTDNTVTVAGERSRPHRNLDYSLIPGEPLYQYTVTRYDFGEGATSDSEPIVTHIGSLYGLEEANLQAYQEAFRAPLRERTVRKRKRSRRGLKGEGVIEEERVPGSEINVVTNEYGCRSVRITDTAGEGVTVEVVRDVAPRREHVPFVLEGAVRLPRKVYIVNQLLKAGAVLTKAGDGEDYKDIVMVDAEEDLEVVTLEVNTVLELANKRAGKAMLDYKTRQLGKTRDDIFERYDREKEMGEYLAELEREDGFFDETVPLEHGGVVKVWVAMLVVKGPRN